VAGRSEHRSTALPSRRKGVLPVPAVLPTDALAHTLRAHPWPTCARITAWRPARRVV